MKITYLYHKLQLNWHWKFILAAAVVTCLIGFSSAVATWQHIHPDRQTLIFWWGYAAVVMFGYVLWVAIALLADIISKVIPVFGVSPWYLNSTNSVGLARRYWPVSHLLIAGIVGTLHLMIDTATLWWLFSGDFDYLEAVGKKLLRWLPVEIIAWWACVGFFTLLAVRARAAVTDRELKTIQRLCYQQNGETHYLDVEHLVFLEACDNYAIATDKDNKQLISESLKSLEQRLDPDKFLRIHRRYLVNMTKVIAWQKQSSGLQLQLCNGEWVPVSRRKTSDVLNFCQNRLSHLAMPL